jgi:phthiocerol/phenolphthiocerol synthesis type-I polyketide synthase E
MLRLKNLFSHMLVYHNEYDPEVKLNIEGLRIEEYAFAKDSSKLDLKLDIVDRPNEGHTCVLQYNDQLYKRASINKLIAHFCRLIDLVVQQPGSKLLELNLFTHEEEHEISARRASKGSDPNLPRTPLVISATCMVTPIERYISWWGRHFTHQFDVQSTLYNQVFQDLLDPASQMSLNNGVNMLFIRFEDWLRNERTDEQTQVRKLEQNFQDLVRIISEKQKSCPYFIGLLPEGGSGFSPAAKTYIDMLNLRWKQALSSLENVFVLDFRGLADLYAVNAVFDLATDQAAHLPFTEEFYAAMGTEVARSVVSWKQPPFKVIVLDCDNTLWQGIVGEDGPDGIVMAEPYIELQKFMLQKKKEGFLCSLLRRSYHAIGTAHQPTLLVQLSFC